MRRRSVPDSARTNRSARDGSLIWEVVGEQLPIVGALLLAGFAAAYLQYGYLPGGERPFPLAGVRVPVWHLIWRGCGQVT